jgi:hypothetical protein
MLRLLVYVLLLVWVLLLWWCWTKNIDYSKNEENQTQLTEAQKLCLQIYEAKKYYPIWSDTIPKINLTHIFCGEINKRWKPVWFHSRPWWKDPITARLKQLIYKKGNLYRWNVQIYDFVEEKRKTKFSSFFPDSYTMEEVINVILYAYKHKYWQKWLKFRWPSGKWFDIEGYILPDWKINTAYPVF